MSNKLKTSLPRIAFYVLGLIIFLGSCNTIDKKQSVTDSNEKSATSKKYPSDVIPFMEEWKILLGDGTKSNKLNNFQNDDFFYVANDGTTNWVVY